MSLGRLAYEAFVLWAHGVHPTTGQTLLSWDELDAGKQAAWDALMA